MDIDRIDVCEVCGGPIRLTKKGDELTIKSMNQWFRINDLIRELEEIRKQSDKLLQAIRGR